MNITSAPATITHIVLMPTDGSSLPAMALLRSVASASARARDGQQGQRRQRQQREIPSSHPSLPPSPPGTRPGGRGFRNRREGRRDRLVKSLAPCRDFGRGRCTGGRIPLHPTAWTRTVARVGAKRAAPGRCAVRARAATSSSPPSIPISIRAGSPPSSAQRRRAPGVEARRGSRRRAGGRGGRAAAAGRRPGGRR